MKRPANKPAVIEPDHDDRPMTGRASVRRRPLLSRAPYLVPATFDVLALSLHFRENGFEVGDHFVFELVALCVVSPLRSRGGEWA